MYKKRYCTVVDIGVGVGRISKMLKFLRLSIYVMSKVLTGEVFCMQTDLDLCGGHITVRQAILYSVRYCVTQVRDSGPHGPLVQLRHNMKLHVDIVVALWSKSVRPRGH